MPYYRTTPRISFARTLPWVAFFAALPVWGDDIGFQRYFDHNEFALTPSGAQKFGLYGYGNPAQLHHVQHTDLTISWTADPLAFNDDRFAATLATSGIGFTFNRNRRAGARVDTYQLSFGGGTDEAASGFGIGWHGGDTASQDLRTYFTLGTLTRPSRHVSVGVVGKLSTGFDYYEAVADVAFRPLGTPALAVFGDYAWGDESSDFAGDWSAGVSSEFLPGVQLAGRYFDGGAVTAGLQFSFGHSSITGQRHQPDSGNGDPYNSYTLRTGGLERNLSDAWFSRQDQYLELDLTEPLTYQRFPILDSRNTLLETLGHIAAAATDDSVAGIVVNTTNMSMSPSMGWELMTSLNAFRETGKQVVLYIENGNMTTLHLTSAADYVVMDPAGTLWVPGLVSGSTYLGELLDDLGVGVDELREMEYKSALEGLSRRDMSEADREQRQALVDGFYEQIRSDVTRGRNISIETYEDIIANGMTLSPQDLIEAGIVDHLSRYDRMEATLRQFEGRPLRKLTPSGLQVLQLPNDDHWGPSHRIALVYASGTTAVDAGMRARAVAKALRDAREDPAVRAVVLRVDSPGGIILAADMVASEVRRTDRVKPVIVSMGNFATSGGYWVSTYGGTILATPLTTTGSIGVIGARLWDDGFGERWGLNSESVSRGPSADATFGITVPLLGLTLPNRPYTEEERAAAVERLNEQYDRFIGQVADGRDMSEEAVRAVAAGRIYTGAQAMQVGLVDDMGNLQQALALAHAESGLAADAKIQVVEGPDMLMPSLFDLIDMTEIRASANVPYRAENELDAYLSHVIEYRGQPQVMIPYEYLNWMSNEY